MVYSIGTYGLDLVLLRRIEDWSLIGAKKSLNAQNGT